MIWILIGLFILNTTGFMVVIFQSHNFFEMQEARRKEHEKWLFDSLYSMNNKILLPNEHEKPSVEKKASVYNPRKDPYTEFKGTQDDFFSEES